MFECIWHYLTEELNDFEWLNKNSKPIQSALMQMTAHHVLLGLVLTSCSAWSLSFQIEPWVTAAFRLLCSHRYHKAWHGIDSIWTHLIWLAVDKHQSPHQAAPRPTEFTCNAAPLDAMSLFLLGSAFHLSSFAIPECNHRTANDLQAPTSSLAYGTFAFVVFVFGCAVAAGRLWPVSRTRLRAHADLLHKGNRILSGKNKWLGGVLGLDDDIYCIPCNKASALWPVRTSVLSC